MTPSAPRWSEITALFGGRFDPPHLGHNEAIQGLFEHPGVREVLVMPSGSPPHKAAVAPDALRLQMARAAFLGGPHPVAVSDIEIERTRRTGLPGYAFDTLQELNRDRGRNLAFVIGADQLRDLPKWHRFPEVLSLSHWIVLERKPDGAAVIAEALAGLQGSGLLRPRPEWTHRGCPAFEISPATGRALIICPTQARELSSTRIREALARREKLDEQPLAPEVREWIRKQRLYGMR